MELLMLRCGEHGDSRATFVCLHLIENVQLGVVETVEHGYNIAVCPHCHGLRDLFGSSYIQEDMTTICVHCYEEIVTKNRL